MGVDLGRLDGEAFANVAILGFLPEVVRATPPGLKRRLGAAAYLLCETRYLVAQTLFDVTVTTDRGSTAFRTRQMIIANGSHYGTRRLAPTARVDDGLLDIIAIDSTSRWQGIRFWLRYPIGRHLRMQGIRRIRCSRARIETAPRLPAIVGGSSDPPHPSRSRSTREHSPWLFRPGSGSAARPPDQDCPARPPLFTCRIARPGTAISNRAPSPGSPLSRIAIPVISRISRTRKSPRPVLSP